MIVPLAGDAKGAVGGTIVSQDGAPPRLKETTMSVVPPRSTSPDLPHVNDELMTLKEVAAMLRVPEATLRYWRHLGTGPSSFRIGRGVRYWRNDVVMWLEKMASA